jgi:hypothetical protein
MQRLSPPFDSRALEAFVALAGAGTWVARIAEIHRRAVSGPRTGQATRALHALELAIERLRGALPRPPNASELHAARLAAEAVRLAKQLRTAGRARLRARLQEALSGDGTLVALFHLLRTAALQRSRGFSVTFAGLEEDAPYDLLIVRDAVEAEITCDVVSAEEGRLVHRGAWFRLADRVDPDLQTWLAAHPGRYLLKMTLPLGLRGDSLASLHQRIRCLLETKGRNDQDAAVVLRLDPLLLAGAQAEENGLLPQLRREFGPEAHLSVTAAGSSAFVMAARAGREDEIAVAVRHRLAALAPVRLTGQRPGILAMFVEDTDRLEWRGLRDRLELEGEARRFLADKAARSVIAVTCASRSELFGAPMPDAAEDGELRFRNPAHPAARMVALAPAVLSST